MSEDLTLSAAIARVAVAAAAMESLAIRNLQSRGLYPHAERIAQAHFVSADELLGDTRTKAVVAARFEFMAFLRGHGLSYPEIGRLLNRDRTTIMSGVKKHNASKKEAA